MSYNKVILMGNLTRDPETRSTTGGQSVTNFSLAVNRVYNDRNGERREEATFVECDAWGPRGETIARYVAKGRQILVEGRLRQDNWEDKDTGKKRTQLKVVVEGFSFVSDRSAGDGAGGAGASAGKKSNSSQDTVPTVDDADEPIDLSEIPF
jgi:single-strand DNA-binding protein